MPLIHFAKPIKDLNGLPVEEVVTNGFFKEHHKELRQLIVDTGKYSDDVLGLFDKLCSTTRVMTVGDVCCRALGGGQNNSNMDAKKFIERLHLIRKIMRCEADKELKPIDLDSIVITDICKAVEKAPLNPYVIMQALDALIGNVADEG